MTTVSTVLGPLYVDDRGSAEEPAALLWPSLFTDHHMWDHQVAALRAAGWRTLALDPPGHGRSPGPGRGFTIDECGEAAVQVLDATGVREPVVLLGTSWGGFVAPRVALRAPDRVSGLALFNTSADKPDSSGRATGAQLVELLANSALDEMVDGLIVTALLGPDEQKIGADLVARLRSWDRGAVVDAVRSVLVDRDGVIDALSDVGAPALIVSGEQDTILPSALSRRMAERMPNARHIEARGVAHLVPLAAPDIANALILDFLGR